MASKTAVAPCSCSCNTSIAAPLLPWSRPTPQCLQRRRPPGSGARRGGTKQHPAAGEGLTGTEVPASFRPPADCTAFEGARGKSTGSRGQRAAGRPVNSHGGTCCCTQSKGAAFQPSGRGPGLLLLVVSPRSHPALLPLFQTPPPPPTLDPEGLSARRDACVPLLAADHSADHPSAVRRGGLCDR
jgi:hypothetical protein